MEKIVSDLRVRLQKEKVQMTKSNGKYPLVHMIDWFGKTTCLNIKFTGKHVAKPDGKVKKCNISQKMFSSIATQSPL